jgi:hypothetical protein
MPGRCNCRGTPASIAPELARGVHDVREFHLLDYEESVINALVAAAGEVSALGAAARLETQAPLSRTL